MSGGAVDIENFGIRKLLAAVSVAALVVSCCLPASAAEYTAANRGELDNAIRAANADADANATIRLTGSFSVNTTSLVIPTKPVTIDTQGFTLSGQAGSGAPGTQINFSGAGAMFTLVGNFKGGNSDTAAGGQGLLIRLGAAVTNKGWWQAETASPGQGASVSISAAPAPQQPSLIMGPSAAEQALPVAPVFRSVQAPSIR